MLSEEEKVIKVEEADGEAALAVFRRIPYALISKEVDVTPQDTLNELTEIARYYSIYKRGAKFTTEGSNGDYTPATLRYKLAASLIDKQARFLFAESPSISVEAKGNLDKVTDEVKSALVTINSLVNTILQSNKFEDALLKAAKDCFIGKRVAGTVNFNEDDGVTVTFLPSTQFVYQTKVGNPNVLTKFVMYQIINDSISQSDKRILKKKYVLEDDGLVWFEEIIYDGAGIEQETLVEYQPSKLEVIPACIFLNDGLTGDTDGESEIQELKYYEQWYSKMANADLDAGRKSMNPTKYVIDMEASSTKNLSTAAGALWDLGSDQNLEHPSPQIGILEPSMTYSAALKTSLDRIRTTGYESVDVPDITNDSMRGMITSGKALKAIYWPLIVRCKEKMKMWGPQLRAMVDIIIKGSMLYPNCIERYNVGPLEPVDYRIVVEQNTPLPEDEVEEKTMDIAEVNAQAMSRKAYMMKWRELTEYEADQELQQIALERQMLEDSFMPQMNVTDMDFGM